MIFWYSCGYVKYYAILVILSFLLSETICDKYTETFVTKY